MAITRRLGVFICHRRADTGPHARALARDLARIPFPIFFDVDSIPYGQRIDHAIEHAMSKAAVCLILVGRNWARNSIASEPDVVLQEIDLALRDNVPTLPILVEGAPLPLAGSIAERHIPIFRQKAFPLRHDDYNDDLRRIANNLDGVFLRCGVGMASYNIGGRFFRRGDIVRVKGGGSVLSAAVTGQKDVVLGKQKGFLIGVGLETVHVRFDKQKWVRYLKIPHVINSSTYLVKVDLEPFDCWLSAKKVLIEKPYG